MRIRTFLFWLHLALGLGAGGVILVLSATGVLLAFERQITAWADGGFRAEPPSRDAARLPVEALLARVVAARPGVLPSALTLQADPTAPAVVNLGRDGMLYVDPYRGGILGAGSRRVRGFFRAVTGLHRWLTASGERSELGGAITAACNLAFLFLVLSGPILWWPRQWTWRQVRNVTWFRRGLAGRARDFNWHNTIGFWAALPLLFIVLTGAIMSYRWANDLLYLFAGEAPPPRQRELETRDRPAGGRREIQAPALNGLDVLWALAERQVTDWRSISLRLPATTEAPVTFTISRGDRARPDLRDQLTLDRRGELLRWEPYAAQDAGRRLRLWTRWAHTGEAGGPAGQTAAGLAAAGGGVLVWTGWAMAWRRLWRCRRRDTLNNLDHRPSGAVAFSKTKS